MHARRKRARCRKTCAERQLVSVDLVELIAPERMRARCSPKEKTRRGISPARAQFQTYNYADSITPRIRQRRFADGLSFASGRFPARGRRRRENPNAVPTAFCFLNNKNVGSNNVLTNVAVSRNVKGATYRT
jgi:hypothetical protein